MRYAAQILENPNYVLQLLADISDEGSHFLRSYALWQLRAFLVACMSKGGDHELLDHELLNELDYHLNKLEDRCLTPYAHLI